MKISLVGSQLEKDYRTQLQASLGLKNFDFLHATLESQNLSRHQTVIIDHIPEQGEDIYTLFTYPDNFLVVEVERESKLTSVEAQLSLKDFLQGKSKMQQIRVLVALDILG